MTAQMQADVALLRWQATRYSDLTPQERIEMAFYDYILPAPIENTTAEFERQMACVIEGMAA